MSDLKGQSKDRGRGEEFKCRGDKVIYIMRSYPLLTTNIIYIN